MRSMTAAIAIDEWKLPIFDRHLSMAGFEFENAGALTAGTLTLKVTTTNLEALGRAVKAANAEAAMSDATQEGA